MLRVGVGLTLVTLTVWTVACSSTTDPGATPRAIARQLVSGKPIPILRDAHVAALPVFDNLKVNPTGLNDLGQIVGDSAVFTTFRWTPGGRIEILPLPDTGFFQALPAGIDDHGRVALTWSHGVSNFVIRAATWEPGGALRFDSALGPRQQCRASAMNFAGTTAGSCDSATVLWPPSGDPQVVHTAGGALFNGGVFAISNNEFMVGNDSSMGFEMSPTRHLTFLPQQRTSPTPLAINDAGLAGGNAFDPTILGFGAVVWPNPDSVIALLPGAGGVTNGVADDGNAIGAVTDTVRGTVVPFIWNSRIGLRRLPPLEMDSLGVAKEQGRAVAVNNRRQVLGFVVLASTGAARWVIWTY
jgi:hypothetical protein